MSFVEYKELKGTTKKVGRSNIIITNYRSVLKDARELLEFLRKNNFYIFKNEWSPSTKSYYIEADNDIFILDIRISNHSKPEWEDQYITIQYNSVLSSINANILDKNDLKNIYAYLSIIIKS